MLFKCRNNIVHLPNKDARIPKEFPTGYKGFGKVCIRFFGKGFHLVYIVACRLLFKLDIAITRVGMAGFDAQGNQCLMGFHKTCGLKANLGECCIIQDDMVCRGTNQRSFFIQLLQLVGNIGNAGRCVFSGGFCYNIFNRNFRKLIPYDFNIFL